ncbi:MAG: prephenate dehydrogenase [Clostridia bacterium]|nr:prephenate dehydrogenase [Clostridia bacterium]
MKIGIAGLGLIGGSLAKAYKESNHTIFGLDLDQTALSFALLSGVLDDTLNEKTIKKCDLILIALPPKATISFLESHAHLFAENQLVIDRCGIKQKICEIGFELAEKHGFVFMGGHPMAGTQFKGFKKSKADMFKGATMALVPPVYDDILLLERAKTALLPAKFSKFTVWTAENHDRIIAYTSQLAHIVSNAYMKSPTVKEHKGLSAGSYRDLTRVAYMNVPMWSELFMENKEPILFELNTLIEALSSYRDAIENADTATLNSLLEEGSARKQEVDKR